MLLFKKENKRNLLGGRTIRYLAKNVIPCSEVHLSNVLNGNIPCSYLLAEKITEKLGNGKKIEDLFIKLEK